ncbi:hypothetical protein LPN04_31195 [Rugamonas sp. A1-17]|nr:hypothetical protein [Rugamonas sp. A1-17]
MPSLPQIQAAFNAATTAEPPEEYILKPDASQLATVIAEMWHFKQDDRDLANLTSSQVAAYERWKVTP